MFPGRLSVSRTFGDIEAKREKFGGNPNVVVASPDIKEFNIDDNMDFLLLGCKYYQQTNGTFSLTILIQLVFLR